MKESHDDPGPVSRRSMLKKSAVFLAGGAAGSTVGALAATPAASEAPPIAPPLPWQWIEIDPLEAGRRAYRNYPRKGGCGSATYLALLSLLKEKVGYPYTTLPDMMMLHAGSGYSGQGTLCGALGGVSLIINLVTFGTEDKVLFQMIDRLFWWYGEQEFPTNRFDDISSIPGQIKVKAMSPLCHTSVSKWTLAAGVEVKSKDKIERCSKVAGEVAYMTTLALNEYFAAKWTPPVWKPAKEIEHCVGCHGPDTVDHKADGPSNQQGHMTCVMCHDDHTL